MRSDTIPDSPHHVLDDLRRLLSEQWNNLKVSVKTRFHLLSEEDINAVEGRYDELSKRVARAHGYNEDQAQDEISRFISEGGGSAMHTPDVSEASVPASRQPGTGHEL